MKISGWLVLVLLLAAALRFVGLDKVPPELFGDELDVGYHAYSIWQTGRDYTGQFLPTYIHSLSEWRTPLLMYVTAPFIGIFGLNEWGVRLPSAVFGLVSVFLLYLLVKGIIKNERVALLSALFLAVSPWHLQYSRAAFEASFLLMLILGGVLTFLQGVKDSRWIFVSAILFALTFYTYSTANLFTPLLLGLLLLVFRKEIKGVPRKNLFGPLLLFVVLSLPIVYHLFFGFAAERYGKFSIFSDEQVIQEVNSRRLDAGNTTLEKLLHNKPLVWGRRMVSNYATSFSPQFLFIDGDVTFRHSIHEIGELFWIQLPLILLGIFYLLRQKEKNAAWFWLGWLLVAPLPAALTRDGAVHATRLIVMLPPLTVLTAAGLSSLLNKPVVKKKTVLVLVSAVLLFEFGLYLHRYWVHYPKESWRWWHTGYKEAMMFMKEKENDYEIIAFNNTYEPALIRFLFWWQYPPERFLKEFKEDKVQENVLPAFDGFSLNKRYYFGLPDQGSGGINAFIKPNILYLVSQRDEVAGDWDWEKEPPSGIEVLKTVRNPYADPIFYIVTAKPPKN